MKRIELPLRVAKSLYDYGGRKGKAQAVSSRDQKILNEFKVAAGRTNLLKLDIPVLNGNKIYAKCEFENPTGSHYDRVYPYLIEILLKMGFTQDRFGLVETSSGNATPAFVQLCKALNYDAWAVLPRADELSKTRIAMTAKKGAGIVHPDPRIDGYGLPGIAKRMLRLIRESRTWEKQLWSPNHSIAAETIDAIQPMATEIADKLDKIDYFIGIPGNGTTLYGVGAPLKAAFPETRIIAVEPYSNPGLFLLKYPKLKEIYIKRGELPQTEPTPNEEDVHEYKIMMPGAGCYGIAELFPHIRASVNLVDSIRQIDDKNKEWEKSIVGGKTANELLFEGHGIRVGITSAASLMVALEIAEKVRDKNFVLIFYDRLEGRY